MLGVTPVLGHAFTAADDSGDAPYAVISYSYWQRRFGGRPDVLGKTLGMRKTTLTIVGIAPRGFFGETSGEQPDMWIPLSMQPMVLSGVDRLHDKSPEKVMWLHVFGRLRPGVTLAQAEAQANSAFEVGPGRPTCALPDSGEPGPTIPISNIECDPLGAECRVCATDFPNRLRRC